MSRKTIFMLGCAVALGTMLGLLVHISERNAAARREADSRPQVLPPKPIPDVPIDLPGVHDLELVSADQTMLDDDEIVIGVEAFGEARAYIRRALENRPERHIVHDELGASPVAITRCEMTGTTRVFTVGPNERSIDLRCGGFLPEQEMELLVGDQAYAQSSPDIPLIDLPFVEMTWKEWRERRPQALIYLGPLGAESD
jgi:hypothetical protein